MLIHLWHLVCMPKNVFLQICQENKSYSLLLFAVIGKVLIMQDVSHCLSLLSQSCYKLTYYDMPKVTLHSSVPNMSTLILILSKLIFVSNTCLNLVHEKRLMQVNAFWSNLCFH